MFRFQSRGFVLFVLFVSAASRCAEQASPKFADWHSRGVNENPKGITVKVRSKDGRSSYRAGEIVNLRLVFTNTASDVYTAKTADVDGDEIVLQRHNSPGPNRMTDRHGVVCCSTVRRGLGKNPLEVSTRLNVRLEPGDYSLFVITKRVSRGWPGRGHYGEGPVLTSDVLQLTIAPAQN